jgi:hypothetical protein
MKNLNYFKNYRSPEDEDEEDKESTPGGNQG